jgi:hypothetical protein
MPQYPPLTKAQKDAQTIGLLKAAEEGDSKLVKTLVCFGVNPNSADGAGCTALHIAAIHDKPAVVWALVLECGVNPASLNRDGKKARDLAPPGSSAYKALEWLEELQTPKHTITATAKKDLIDRNAKKRAAPFECALCLEEKKDVVAIVPCGHRVCLKCWEKMRLNDTKNCPHCRAQILHGVPQKQWPDEHPLYARFGVEVGGAQAALRGRARRFCVEARELAPSHSDGADWQLNGTTTDGMMKSVRAVFGTCKINLEVVTRNDDVWENMPPPKIYEIDKSKSIYSQIRANVKLDKWEGVEVCIDGVAQCDILIEGGTEDMIIKFNATCNKEIETAEAKRPKTPVYLRVTVEAYHVVIRKRTERQRERAASLAAGKKRFNEMMTRSEMKDVSNKMTELEKTLFLTKWGAETPYEFCFPPRRTWDP